MPGTVLYVVNIMVRNEMECPLLSGYINYQCGRCCGERSWGHKRHNKGNWLGQGGREPVPGGSGDSAGSRRLQEEEGLISGREQERVQENREGTVVSRN